MLLRGERDLGPPGSIQVHGGGIRGARVRLVGRLVGKESRQRERVGGKRKAGRLG